MKKKKRITITKEYLDSLKNELEGTKSELERVKADRQMFRDFYITLLKDNTSAAGKGQYYSPESMILRLGALLNKVQNWYWL